MAQESRNEIRREADNKVKEMKKLYEEKELQLVKEIQAKAEQMERENNEKMAQIQLKLEEKWQIKYAELDSQRSKEFYDLKLEFIQQNIKNKELENQLDIKVKEYNKSLKILRDEGKIKEDRFIAEFIEKLEEGPDYKKIIY